MQEWQIEPSYHFIVDLVEVDLAHFLHHVFILKCYKAESCKKTIDHNNSHNTLELDNRPFSTVVQLNSVE